MGNNRIVYLLCFVLIIMAVFSGRILAHDECDDKSLVREPRLLAKNLSDPQSELSKECLACFRESLQILNDYGDRIWKGFSRLDVRVNIITPHYEFFFGDRQPPAGYQSYSDNSLPDLPIFYKKREYRHEFAALVDAIGERPAIFISSKEVFEKTYSKSPLYKIAEDYIFTIMEQYYHLHLAESDFMLSGKISTSRDDLIKMGEQYPYLDYLNSKLLEIEGEELRFALEARDRESMREHIANFDNIRKLRLNYLEERLGIDFKTYENWSEWYDGLAKYTEVEFARITGSKGHKPFAGMLKLANFRNYEFNKNKYVFELGRLKSTKNTLVHSAIGMAEAYLLDKLGLQWKDDIFRQDKLFSDFISEYLKKPKDAIYY